ncbi:MAG: hypothetical protein R3F62_22330 [Planctomycetota bacterium]
MSRSSTRPAAAPLRGLLLALNLVLLGLLGELVHGLFWGALPDPLPRVAPVARALDEEPPPPAFAGLVALVAQELDAPLPDPEPEPEAPQPQAPSPLAGWEVVALLEPAGGPPTAILGAPGRQVTVQAGDAFLHGEVRAIAVDPDGRVRVEVHQGAIVSHLEQRFGPP